jgi:hypothetical protein
MDKKYFLSSIATVFLSLLVIVTVSFAWFAISKTAETPFFAEVGNMQSKYEFASITQGNVEDNTDITELHLTEVMPGSKFTFGMIVENESELNGTISVNFNNVKSYLTEPDPSDNTKYIVHDEYENPHHKIQYAFSYSVLDVYWIPKGTTISGIDQSDPLGKIDPAWVEFTDAEKALYYPTYNNDLNADTVLDSTRFNGTIKDNNNQDVDQNDYTLLNSVKVDNSDKAAFIVFFQINFVDKPVFPDFITEDETNFDGNVYGNQLFGISNITIVSMRDE